MSRIVGPISRFLRLSFPENVKILGCDPYLLKEEVASGNIEKAKEIKNIMDREIARKTWGRIGRDL